MTSEKPYMHCRQCGIRYRSDKAADHDRQCPSNDSQKSPSPSLSLKTNTSSSGEKGNQIRDKSKYYSQPGKKEFKTVTKEDGVKKVHETVEYKDESPGGRNEFQEKTLSRSDSLKGATSLNAQETEEKQNAFRQETEKEDEKNEKKDIGKHPYPTEKKLKKEKQEVPVPQATNPVDEFIQKLPEFDRQAETAYESHKQNLTPCSHCERTFTPDRLAKHEKICEEKSDATITDKK